MDRYSETDEHILVCVSPSPSNPKVVAAAARMAEAFKATLTAIYVKPTNYDALPEEDRTRLQNNIRFAERSGASITTVVGDDVPVQVAEYAHISGKTKLVVGRRVMRRRRFWSKPPLTEQIILSAPDVDVYIIPDSAVDFRQQRESPRITERMPLSARESAYTLLLLAARVFRIQYHHRFHPGRPDHLRGHHQPGIQRGGLADQRAAVQLVFHRPQVQLPHL